MTVCQGQAQDLQSRPQFSHHPTPHSPRLQHLGTHQAPREPRKAPGCPSEGAPAPERTGHPCLPWPLTSALALAICRGLVWHGLCPSRQREQMQLPCWLQKNSKSLLCRGHLRCCRSRRGGQSWWSRKAGLSQCGCRCSEQKDAVQVRQVCTAGACWQLSHKMGDASPSHPTACSSASASGSAQPWSCSTTRHSTVFFCSCGRPAKVARHCGQLKFPDSPAQESSRQEAQKLCPQGTVTGLLNRQRQMEQVSSSSSPASPGSDGSRASAAMAAAVPRNQKRNWERGFPGISAAGARPAPPGGAAAAGVCSEHQRLRRARPHGSAFRPVWRRIPAPAARGALAEGGGCARQLCQAECTRFDLNCALKQWFHPSLMTMDKRLKRLFSSKHPLSGVCLFSTNICLSQGLRNHLICTPNALYAMEQEVNPALKCCEILACSFCNFIRTQN